MASHCDNCVKDNYNCQECIYKCPTTGASVRPVSYKVAKEFLFPRHYSGRVPSISYAFGLYDGCERLLAVCTFGKPASNSLCEGVCGKELSSKVYELNRLCRLDNVKIPMSWFVSRCLRELKSLNLIIVSYSDTGMTHHGYVYQALNFLYTGQTKQRTDKYTEGNKHSRHYGSENQHLRKVRTSKHRYIYFACNRKLKKEYRAKLNYPVLPFPKGENRNYKLGEFQKTKVLNTKDKSETLI